MKKFKTKFLNLFIDLDIWIFLSVVTLILIGIFAVFSASTRIDEKYDLLFKKHLIFCILGFFVICVISKATLKNVIFLSILIFLVSLMMSLSTIIFFSETKGASRWIKILNFSFQPSEIIKPSFVIISSLLLSRFKSKTDYSFFANVFIFVVISIILLKQPDFGMFLLIFVVWIIQIFNSRLDLKIITPIVIGFASVIVSSYIFLDHVRFRINNFFFSDIGDNYQINKSLDSFANGGLFGKGLGNGSVSKSLPDAHSDFIFALVGEEFGFLTVFAIIFLYMLIYLRVFFICQKTENFFIINSISGLVHLLIFQTIINISSTLNILPTKGMTLPFISYGGSSFLSCAILIGFIMVFIKEGKNE